MVYKYQDYFSYKAVRLLEKLTAERTITSCCRVHHLTHISQVQDEAVSLVEAVPADRHLCCPDNTATFDLEHPLHDHLVSDDVLEPRRHAPFLEG